MTREPTAAPNAARAATSDGRAAPSLDHRADRGAAGAAEPPHGHRPEPIPYGRQSIDEDDIAAVTAVLRGERLTGGSAVARFEAELSQVCGGSAIAAVSSGTAALHAAYATAGIGPGTEVVTTPLTFAATATAALHLGAEVVFADVTPDTLTLDPTAAAQACGSRTTAVTGVDFAGHPCEADALTRVAHDAGATFVCDAAHSLGSTLDGRPAGSYADLSTFSFHPVKTITTAEGGAVAARDADLVDRVRRFRDHGMVRNPAHQHHPETGPWHQEVTELGLNYRLSDLHAALGRSQLAKLAAFVARRRELAANYDAALSDLQAVSTPAVTAGAVPAWHLYPVRVPAARRADIFASLRDAGVGVQVHYEPVHHHPVFADRGHRPAQCPNAEEAAAELISLPLHPGLTESEQEQVVASLHAAL